MTETITKENETNQLDEQTKKLIKATILEISKDPIATIPPADRLWNAKDCARYFGVSHLVFLRDIQSKPNFPKEFCNLSQNERYPRKRWKASDVMKYRPM
jgi:hypothetical protein